MAGSGGEEPQTPGRSSHGQLQVLPPPPPLSTPKSPVHSFCHRRAPQPAVTKKIPKNSDWPSGGHTGRGRPDDLTKVVLVDRPPSSLSPFPTVRIHVSTHLFHKHTEYLLCARNIIHSLPRSGAGTGLGARPAWIGVSGPPCPRLPGGLCGEREPPSKHRAGFR